MLLPLLVAGVGIVLGSVLLHTMDLSASGTGVATGFVQGTLYFITGWVISATG